MDWYQQWFLPTLTRMQIESVSWEQLVDFIRSDEPVFGAELSDFYTACLKFNRVQEPEQSG
jgi:hypothetical protein